MVGALISYRFHPMLSSANKWSEFSNIATEKCSWKSNGAALPAAAKQSSKKANKVTIDFLPTLYEPRETYSLQ